MPDRIEAVGLEFDTRQYERALNRAIRKLDDLEDRIDGTVRAGKQQSTMFDNIGRKVLALAGTYVSLRGAMTAGRFIFNTNREFEQLEARLVSITGSTEAAARAFNMITEFAKTTPFEIQNLVRAFTTLEAAGITPDAGMLRDLGNFAAAMGKDITDLVEAILRASQGGTERLRESFFVPISKEGDKLRINFRGVEREVAADARSLLGYFQEIGSTEFGDGMSRQMETIGGRLSNLADSASIVAKRMGDTGLNHEMMRFIGLLDEGIQNSEDLAVSLGDRLATALEKVNDALNETPKGGTLWAFLQGAGTGTPFGPFLSGLGDRTLGGTDDTTRNLFGVELGLDEPAAAAAGSGSTGGSAGGGIKGGLKAPKTRQGSGVKSLADAMKDLKTMTQGAASAEKDFKAALMASKDITDKQTASIDDMNAELEQLKSAADRMAESLIDAFLDAGDGMDSLWDRIGNAVDGILSELARLAIRRGITEPLINAAFSAMEGGKGDAVSSSGGLKGDIMAAGGSAMVVNQNVNFSVSAIDARDATRFIEERKGDIAKVVGDAAKQSTGYRRQLMGA